MDSTNNTDNTQQPYVPGSHLSDEELDNQVESVLNYRKALSRHFKTEYLIDFIRELVENSKFISFFNKRSEKFIDSKTPVFRLSVPLTKELYKKYNISDSTVTTINNIMEVMEAIETNSPAARKLTSEEIKLLNTLSKLKSGVVNEDIITPLTDKMAEVILQLSEKEGYEELKKVKDEMFETFPNKEDAKKYLVLNIFKVLVGATKRNSNLVVLEYIL